MFVGGLKRRGNTLYDTNDKLLIVNEFAMKINGGEWREYEHCGGCCQGLD
jgi:hypothetical protein